MKITEQLSRFNHYEGGNTKEYIIIHSTGNTNDTAKNNADYFGRADRGASANYFVDDDSIYQVVKDDDCSWNCGDGNNKYGIGNRNTISIEMCGTDNGNISDKTIENTIELTKALMSKYGIDIDHVVRHYDASRKCCPSQFSPNNWQRWYEFKKSLNSDNSSLPSYSQGIKGNIDVTYQTYVDGRWLPNVVNLEDYAGIYGRPIQCVYVNLSKGSIRCRVHINNRWLPWVTDRQDYAGIYGTNIDGIQMELSNLDGYSVKYRAYVEGRWLPWVVDLEDYAGIYGKPIEGIQVQIISK